MAATMEGELRRLNVELWNSYEHAYDKAVKEWLPLVSSNMGSSNALPHLIGVRQHIDMLLYERELCQIDLSAAELYVLLCAVLMHDVGKASYFSKASDVFKRQRSEFFAQACAFHPLKEEKEPSDSVSDCAEAMPMGNNPACEACHYKEGKCPYKPKPSREPDFGHAQTAHYIISRNWYDFGLYSDKLARIIARVCCFHECGFARKCELNNEYYVEGFGRIRARTLAALLLLGDHLDDTYTRASPDYFSGVTADIGSIAKFRGKIQYIRFDKKNKMIASVIDRTYMEKSDFSGRFDFCESTEKAEDAAKSYIKYKTRNLGVDRKNALWEYLRKKLGCGDEPVSLPECGIAADLVGHTFENQADLSEILNELHILNMPIKMWMLECDGHIFSIEYVKPREALCMGRLYSRCDYALEPTLDKDFCDSVFYAMIEISKSVFGRRVFTYYDILNYMHEFNDGLDKVKTAVRRIERILTYCREIRGETGLYELYLNDNIWSLRTPDSSADMKTSISGLLDSINQEK